MGPHAQRGLADVVGLWPSLASCMQSCDSFLSSMHAREMGPRTSGCPDIRTSARLSALHACCSKKDLHDFMREASDTSKVRH